MLNFFLKTFNRPIPSNIYYWWNFGSLLGAVLALQILSGLFLSIFYENRIIFAFDSIIQIERNINIGWILRSLHANGASLFFIFIYLHVGRGLYFKSFYLSKVWASGSVILVLLFLIAFIGYVLPWGQIRFWGATVITNLLSAIPYLGVKISIWVWGGFSVEKATLMRFFSFHFIIPFILLFFSILHIIFLHEKGSRRPLGNKNIIDKIPFNFYFLWKDILGILISFFIFIRIIFIRPVVLMDPDNFIPANSLSTPPHIQPEWYFLFAYAILRTVPNKLGGVIALIMSILIIFFLIFIKNNFYKKHTLINKILFKIIFYFWVLNFFFITVIGAIPIETPYLILSKIRRILYFLFFVIFL